MRVYVAKGTAPMFPERPREHVAGAAPLSLSLQYLGELLEDSGCGQKSLSL